VLDATVLVRAHPASSFVARKAVVGTHRRPSRWWSSASRTMRLCEIRGSWMWWQTAERGEADLLCSEDGDFHEPGIVAFCGARGIEVCREAALLSRLRAAWILGPPRARFATRWASLSRGAV